MKLQVRLNALGASPALDADGSFGPKTSNAVASFQLVHDLEADGVVGPKTHRALDEAAITAPGGRVLEKLDRLGDEAGPDALGGTSPLGGLLGIPLTSTLKVDRIELVATSPGVAGYPAKEPQCGATLNNPGPFNDLVQGSIVNVHQVHVHMKTGAAGQPKVTRLVKRTASAGGQAFAKDGNDGPPPHEFKFPKGPEGDLLVVADAPGWCRSDLNTSRFPLTYSAEFRFFVFDPLTSKILASIEYSVGISKQSKSDAAAINTVTLKKKSP